MDPEIEINSMNKTINKPDVSVLSKEICQAIDHWLGKYPKDQKQSALLAALTLVQDENGGFLTEPLLDGVADYLQIPRIAAYEAATFYSMYDLQVVGKYKISVCDNISCQLRDAQKIITHLQDRLNVKVGETTADGKFTLRRVECLAACVNAPMMQIGNHYYEDLTPEKVDKIIDNLD